MDNEKMISGNNAVNNYYDIPRIQRKHYEKMARIARNERRHEELNKPKQSVIDTAE
jgi:hypothetical protein